MKKPRLFSLLTAAVLTVTGFWQNAALTASAEPEFFGAEIPSNAAIAHSENTFGAMIADTVNQENARILMSSVVHSVEMNGTEATVSYDSKQAGRAVVCVYEDVSADSAPRLLGTGIQAFTAELNTVTVPVQMKALPEFYLVRVFLIGENDVPLSAEFSDPMHTREMQMLRQSSISDFIEDYEVMNLDDSTETNFAVYNENVEVLHYSETENCVLSQDNENCVFEIQNYTGPTRTGTVVSVECGNGTAAIFKIGSVKTDGDVTTIQGDRSMDTNDAFAYLKMETGSENNTASYIPPELTDEFKGVDITCSVGGSEKPVQKRPVITAADEDTEAEAEDDESDSDEPKEIDNELNYRFEFGKTGEGFEVDGVGSAAIGLKGVLELNTSYHITILKSHGYMDTTLEISNTVDMGLELSVGYEFKLPLGTAVCINPCSAFELYLGPYFKVSITGTITFSAEFDLCYSSEEGFTGEGTVAEVKVELEGFIGFGIGGGLKLFKKYGGEVFLEAGIDIVFETNALAAWEVGGAPEADHSPHKGCSRCSSLTLSFMIRFNATLDLGLVEFGFEPTFTRKLGSCYLSDTLGFGFGDCPNSKRGPEEEPQSFSETSEDGLTELERSSFNFVQVNDGYAVSPSKRTPGSAENPLKIPSYYKGVPVVEILPQAFNGVNQYHNIEWPEQLKRIGKGAFNSAIHFKKLELPASVEEIGENAFSNCEMEEVELPVFLNYMGKGAFQYCQQLRSVKFHGQSLTAIPDRAFADCIMLTDLTFPEKLQHIGKEAFSKTPEIPLEFPSTLQTIGDKAFEIDRMYNRKYPDEPLCPDYDLVLPASIMKIGTGAFNDRLAIKKIIISDQTSQNFKLSWMKGIYSIDEVILPSDWTYIHKHDFLNCNAKAITLPSNLQTIAPYAFENMYYLEQLVLPDSVTRIGKGAFSNCRKMHAITLPQNSSFTEIPAEAFSDCHFLSSISIPTSVTRIGNNAFRRCMSLSSIKIPKEVSSMYFSAFSGYTSEFTGSYPTLHQYNRTTGIEDSSWNGVNAKTRSITFYNPNIRFLDSPRQVSADYIPAGETIKAWEYSRVTLAGYSGSTAEAFAQNPDHTCTFIWLIKPAVTVTTVEPENEPLSMTFTNLLPDTTYNFYDLLGEEFTADNLLYLSQGVSDETGTLTVFYRPKSDDTAANKYVKCASTETPVSKIKGDLNGDFVVDVSDAVLCARFCAEDAEANISRQGVLNADVNGDGNTDPNDTVQILKFIAHIITSFD